MQEIVMAQGVDNIFEHRLTLQTQRQMMKCIYKNQAYSVCISPQCSISGLMCMNLTCQCRKSHYKCHHIQLDRVLDSIERHQKQLPNSVKQSYKAVYHIINGMIDQLSKVRLKLQLQEKYFGLGKQQLAFIEMIDDSKIQNICGKVVSELQKTFQSQIDFTVAQKQKIIIQSQSKKQQFMRLCNDIQNSFSKFDAKNQNKLFKDSVIIRYDEENNLLYQWTSESLNSKKLQSQLLFRASEHSFKAAQFHKYCDGVNNTLVIVKNQFDRVIGGFNPNAWRDPRQSGFIKDLTGNSFIFSINLKQKYKCIQPQYSTWCGGDWGPIFGYARAFGLKDSADKNNESDANGFPGSYNIQIDSKKKYENNQKAHTLFTGNPTGNNFKVKQYEVYQIKAV